MDERPSKPSPWLWPAVGLFVMLGYPLSMGPARWIIHDAVPPPSKPTAMVIFSTVYYPMYRLYDMSPNPIQNAWDGYMGLGKPPHVPAGRGSW